MEESGSTPSNVEDFDAFRKLSYKKSRACRDNAQHPIWGGRGN